MLGGTPSPRELETSVSLSQPLPHTSCPNPPCLSFPVLYTSPFTPNCLFCARSKALSVGPWERGREGTAGLMGWQEPPLPKLPRPAISEAGRHKNPSHCPSCVGPPSSPWARQSLVAPSTATAAAWRSRLPVPAPSRRLHGRAASRRLHGRAAPAPSLSMAGEAGGPGGGGAEQDAGIGSQRDD